MTAKDLVLQATTELFANRDLSATGCFDLPPSTERAPAAGRLEPAASFNPMFTHRVRITAISDIDGELRG